MKSEDSTEAQYRDERLVKLAKNASRNAHCPFSHFKVGAVLVCEDGEIYTGCNIENSSFGLSICAERVAVFKAISHGKKEFSRMVIYTDSARIVYPCGACLQVLAEFAPDMDCILTNGKREVRCSLNELKISKVEFEK